MKRLLLFVSIVVLFLACSNSAVAQNINASATVLTELTYTVNSNVDFANVSRDIGSTTPTIDPAGNHTGIVSGTPSVGKVEITGSGSEEISITFPTSVTLNESSDSDGNTDQLTYSPDVVGEASDNSTSTVGNASAVTTGDNLTLDSSGFYTLWFGGTLGVGDTGGQTYVESGDYSGTFELTIAYTTN